MRANAYLLTQHNRVNKAMTTFPTPSAVPATAHHLYLIILFFYCRLYAQCAKKSSVATIWTTTHGAFYVSASISWRSDTSWYGQLSTRKLQQHLWLSDQPIWTTRQDINLQLQFSFNLNMH